MPRHRKSLAELARDGTFLARKDERLLAGRSRLPWPELERFRSRYSRARTPERRREIALELERALRQGDLELVEAEVELARIEPQQVDRDLAGVSEAAAILGVSRNVILYRRKREPELGDDLPPFPPPVAELACGPIWNRSQLERYRRECQRRRSLTYARRYDEDARHARLRS